LYKSPQCGPAGRLNAGTWQVSGFGKYVVESSSVVVVVKYIQ